ncbi:MAG: threonylcarbamoyl-AMP synthase [Wenzhouxiangellaceae bacterium]|nr:threonylcarbamoyl-AMP synthase [Wenzhouxiangellaceae bacterium]MBS3823369.1 threonylcarbamoyl-AMP synthase [Wenzhouxiangellaceae bacterium]
MIRLGSSAEDLERAADLLRAGQLVAFPTETVYGLGADAANPEAVADIFRAKGRPADHPVIVHLPAAEALAHWARDVSASAQRLADMFWPGPLTLVLKRAEGVSDAITGGQDTVGLRVPGNPTALALLQAFGGAVAAPSANRFGHVSPTTAEHVIEEFSTGEVAAVVDGGPCAVGVESTIVDLSGSCPRLLRPGMIRIDAIEAELGVSLARAGDRRGPRASGRLESHYAPGAVLEMVDAGVMAGRMDACAASGERIAVLARREAPATAASVSWIEMPRQPVQFARALYAALRRADAEKPDRILVESPPVTPGWEAISDRLSKAAGPRPGSA